jgi:hypothetical protein
VVRAAVLLALLATAVLAHGELLTGAASAGCPDPRAGSAYTARVMRTLASPRDVLGNALLASSSGPTYARARQFLSPLLLARASRGRPLTESGVYYLPFAQPLGAGGARSVALHVADGSQILSQRVGGTSLTVDVGRDGGERYGSCLARLAPARLGDGYLPILQTAYTDADGVRYRQESFAARIAETDSLVTFVRLTADARRSAGAVRLRFTPSVRGLAAGDGRLAKGGRASLLFGEGGAFDGSALSYAVPAGSTRTVVVAWLDRPSPTRPLVLDETRYADARRSVAEYWRRRLSEGTTFVVPERRVMDAERSLLIQNLGLTWRYSIGNGYEEFSFPESVDAAEVMSEYGFAAVARSMLRTSLTRSPTPYPNWKMGEKLLGSALQYRLLRDRAFVEQVTPVLRRYVATLGRQIRADRRGLLRRERYSSDIPDSVYGLHSQAVVWQGLRLMGLVWEETGHGALATACRGLAAKLEAGLRGAVRDSQRRLPDGSLFVPVRLLDGEPPYDSLTESRAGSYWNLVMPYALASGLFAPGSPEATGVLHYLLGHGSRLLGLVRAGAYALYGRTAAYPVSGTDQVYGLNAARFLADNDQADQLVLSLYGQLAAGMTPDTFVAGEGASVAPLAGASYRSMYLPPNAASNAAFLETLRLLLVHETSAPNGVPRGLELAYATPRAWLDPGRRIVVHEAPTSFGPLSYELDSRPGAVDVSVDVPSRPRPRTLRLRLRLRRGERITGVLLAGRPFRPFDAATGTLDLSGRTGSLALVVHHAPR